MRAKGSLTVEAAFTVPLSFFAVVVFLNLFLFLQVQIRVQKEIASIGNELMSVGTLFSKAQAAGSEATASDLSAVGVDGLLRQLGTEQYLSYRMKEKVGGESWVSHIRNGVRGFSFSGSKIYDGDMNIRILVSYSYVFDNTLFSLGAIPVRQQVVARGFSGKERKKTDLKEDEDNPDEVKVYVTENGTVFHRLRDCTYLKPDIRQVTPEQLPEKRNSSGKKYYACEYCGDAGDGSVYYITTYGTRFHTTVSCRELVRTVSEISEKEAINRGLRPCGKCGGKTE